ncbi:MAG: glycosyltransferase family 39 protein [Taibaiella sp.]|nr:glycosyltransferase family 39 protein [Taibaiella sp.]
MNWNQQAFITKRKSSYWFWTAVLLMLVPCFFFMERMPVQLWDESRLAINAAEMSESGNWLVTTFDGKIDNWNTKPPLLIWMQAMLIRVFGLSIWAIRLPSAIAGLLTGILLFRFITKNSNSHIWAVLSVIVLFTAHGYVREHILRTGDYDALLVLFTTFYAICYTQFLSTRQTRDLYLFFSGLTLAVLTKSVAGLFLLPSLFLYTLYRKQLFFLLKSRHFYMGICAFVLLVSAYYLGRESVQPGYLDRVRTNEWSGRFMNTVEAHRHPFYYYINNLSGGRFSYWFPLLVAGVVMIFYTKNENTRSLGIFSLFMAVPFLFLISAAETKLLWYDGPVFPFLAILASLPLYLGYPYLLQLSKKKQHQWKYYGFAVLFVLILLIPYGIMVHKIGFKADSDIVRKEYAIPRYISRLIKSGTRIPPQKILSDIYNPHYQFPVLVAQDQGYDIALIEPAEEQEDDLILTNEEKMVRYLYANYEIQKDELWEGLRAIKTGKRKSDH